MPEVGIRVEATKVVYICDECHKGEMLFNGKIYYTERLKYEHECSECKKVYNLILKYPRHEY